MKPSLPFKVRLRWLWGHVRHPLTYRRPLRGQRLTPEQVAENLRRRDEMEREIAQRMAHPPSPPCCGGCLIRGDEHTNTDET